MLRSLLFSLLVAGFCPPLLAQGQGPIHMIFDMHCDPITNNATLPQKQAQYQTWIDNMNWVLDQTDPLGVQISFLSAGAWAEFAAQGGENGPGGVLLRRLYQSGAQLGSHSHSEYRAGANDWPTPAPTALQCWQDNIDWVDAAILTAFGGSPPEALADINSVRGSHLPSDATEYHGLMALFGFETREGGAEEDYFGWYDHHIWQPFRPAIANYMAEDLNTSFVVPPQGSVIGLAQVHHGVFQDMTAPAVKRQFLQLYVNWRYRDRFGLPEKVWSWGWGSHASDFDPADPSRAALVEVLGWLDANFAARVEPTGSDVMVWDTQRGTTTAYSTWEAAHPGTSSFSFASLSVNWNEYPYLRAVAEEMEGFQWVADLSLGAGIEAYQLRKGPLDAVLLWQNSGNTTLDLSPLVGPDVRMVALETGRVIGLDATLVTVGQEPLLVTEERPTTLLLGTPSPGSTITLRVTGPPDVPANLFYSLQPANISIPHLGVLRLDPSTLGLLAAGVTTGGQFSIPAQIPNNPNLIGFSIEVQGVVFLFDGASPKLAANAVTVLVQ